MKAWLCENPTGVDALTWQTLPTPRPGKGEVLVDDWSQTSVPSIFAVGDVTDRINLTPVAIREGHAFADTVFRGVPTRFDHKDIASAVFTQPPIAAVGLTENDARALCAEVKEKCEIVPTAWDGIIPALTSKQIDVIIASMLIKPKRKEVIDFKLSPFARHTFYGVDIKK